MRTISREDIFDISTQSAFEPAILESLEEAAHNLGQLNQLSMTVFEYSFITDVLKNIEALTSAQIEGTTGNLEDLYMEEALSLEQKTQLKLFSALNYKYTLHEVEDILRAHPKINEAVVRHIHKLLTENDPATSGKPGGFRTTNVKIRNTKLGDFYPPESISVPGLVQEFMEGKPVISRRSLLDIAIKHYQFESIHPFEDGNGRTGRLLIIAYLLDSGLLQSPILNLSYFFEKNRDEYILALRNVSQDKDYKKWIMFFFKAITIQSQEVVRLIQKLKKLKKKDEEKINSKTRGTPVPLFVLEFALNRFFFTVPQLEGFLKRKKLPLKDLYQTARKNVQRLEEWGIIEKSHKRQQTDVYVHKGLRNLLMGDKKKKK